MKRNLFIIIFFLITFQEIMTGGNFPTYKDYRSDPIRCRPSYYKYILSACSKYDIYSFCYYADEIVDNVIRFESSMNPRKVEIKNNREISWGLTQIGYDSYCMYQSHNKNKPFRMTDSGWKEDLYKPQINIDIFCWLLKQNLIFYEGDWHKALSAHNLGRTGLYRYSQKTGHSYYALYTNGVNRKGYFKLPLKTLN